MKDLKWHDALQLGALLLVAVAMPISWYFGFWSAMFLALASLVKLVLRRRIGNPALDRKLRWPLYAMLAYWLGIALSALWSSDVYEALRVVSLKASMLVFPLSFLMTDTSYLRRRHLRWLGYALVASCLVMFGYWMLRTIVETIAENGFDGFGSMSFDTRHHSYIALYLTVALVFIYFELVSYWATMHKGLRTALIAAVPLLIFYAVLINSRAGLLCLFIIEVACMLHWAWVRRRGWRVLPLALLLVGFTVGVGSVIPGHENRLLATFIDLRSEQPQDPRLKIAAAARRVALDSPWVGYGVGDYRYDLLEAYAADGYEAGVRHQANAHNQYLESILAAGVGNLLLLVAFLLMPVVITFVRHSDSIWLLLALTFVFAFNSLFESMLERQMGVLFFGLVYAIMVLVMSTEAKPQNV